MRAHSGATTQNRKFHGAARAAHAAPKYQAMRSSPVSRGLSLAPPVDALCARRHRVIMRVLKPNCRRDGAGVESVVPRRVA